MGEISVRAAADYLESIGAMTRVFGMGMHCGSIRGLRHVTYPAIN